MDVFINKLTLTGSDMDIDLFMSEQINNGHMSFKTIMPIPEDLSPEFSDYETEFIHSDYDNALIFKRTESGFTYKHVKANIYPFYNSNDTHDWATDNWQTTFDIEDQDLFINRTDGKVEISFATRYSYPFIWFYELDQKYNNLDCTLESMSYEYKYAKLTVINGALNFDREPMPYHYQFDSLGLAEDCELSAMEALGSND